MQGIVNPLMVQKTDKRGGTIVSSPAAQAQAAEAAKKPKVGSCLNARCACYLPVIMYA